MPPSTEPATVPTRVKRAWTAGIVAALVLLATMEIIRATRDNPEDVVYDYFAAILDGDTDTALEFVGTLPKNSSMLYLTPEAISDDWQLLSANALDYESRGRAKDDARVEVKIGGPDGTAEGTMAVRYDEDEGWEINQPPVGVYIEPSPLDYLQINGYTPEPQATEVEQTVAGQRKVYLLPGVYKFYEDIPGVVKVGPAKAYAALPSPTDRAGGDIELVTVPKVVAGPEAVASARKQLRRHLSDCVAASVPQPRHCPFSVRSFVNTVDGEHIEDLRELDWELERTPEFTLVDSRYAPESVPGTTDGSFRFHTEDLEVLTLRGKGVDSDGEKIDFEVPCRVDLSGTTAKITASGKVRLSSLAGNGDSTCGKEL